jgi:hypothetical protein
MDQVRPRHVPHTVGITSSSQSRHGELAVDVEYHHVLPRVGIDRAHAVAIGDADVTE